MINFDQYINLPFIWGVIIVIAILMYIILDGFDLGVGILFPFAPSDDCRDKMMNSIAPFWDGNETWLILGGGGLFAAFPLAYSIIMPALYVPVLLMLVSLIFRGVAFEFRFKASKEYRKYWDVVFHFGSLFAAFMQGMILGGLVQGIDVQGNSFAGSAFDWLSGFSFMTGMAVVFGYGLLGSSWLFMKTTDITQDWSKKAIKYMSIYVLFFMTMVSVWMPYIDNNVFKRWFSWPNMAYLAIVPLLVVYAAFMIYRGLKRNVEWQPFVMTILLFVLGFVGLMINTWPYVVPRYVTFTEAAAAPESLSIMLIAVCIVLPVILFYTGYSYYVFRGKAKSEDMYAEN
jgi:cytochrome d ubiquinol oxidase subunit II